MIDFKQGLRHIGSFRLPPWSETERYAKKMQLVVNPLIRAGFVLFCNEKDVYLVDVYAKPREAKL